jgi:gluconolactonase
VRLDPGLDAVVTADARVERVATGFGFTEGPVWVRKGGFLIFSDIPVNVIHRLDPPDGRVSVFLDKTGFTGTDASDVGGEQTNAKGERIYLIGSNGVTVDPQGRVACNAMGDTICVCSPPPSPAQLVGMAKTYGLKLLPERGTVWRRG